MNDGSPSSTPALVLVAHGSRDPEAARAAESIRSIAADTRPDLVVELAYLDHSKPTVADVLDHLPAGSAVLVPLLLATAYHVRVDLAAAADASRENGRKTAVADPLGSHPLLYEAAGQLLHDAGAGQGAPVVLASAGTTDPAANDASRAFAAELSTRLGAPVVAAFAAAAAPSIHDAIRGLTTGERVFVLRWVLAPGRFAQTIASAAASADATYTEVLGHRPELATIVLERYDAAAARASYPSGR